MLSKQIRPPGSTPLGTSLTAALTGTAVGTINYTFWWNCTDPGSSVSAVTVTCGDPTNASIGAKFSGVTGTSRAATHVYSSAGTFTAKVIAQRGTAAPAEARATITVTAPVGSFGSSGRVTTPGGMAISSATMTFARVSGTGSIPGAVLTDATGTWSRSGFQVGTTYRVTPTKTGYSFAPSFLEFGGESTGLNFTGNSSSLFGSSGRVTTAGGTAISSVTMTFTRVSGTGSIPGTVLTDATGTWSRSGFQVGTTYRVTPTKTGYGFAPSFLEFSGESTGLNFTGNSSSFGSSGRVTTAGGTAISSVTMTFTRVSGTGSIPGTVLTDATGTWSRSGFQVGTTYRVTPTKTGYSFAPSFLEFSGESTGLNFTGTSSSLFGSSGRVTTPGGTAISSVTMTFTRVSGTGSIPGTVLTDATGTWSRSGFQVGTTYRVTPTKTGYSFAPSFLEFSGESTGLNFTGNSSSFGSSGRVTTAGGIAISSVTMTFTRVSGTGSIPGTVLTDATGTWSRSGFQVGTTYRVTPTKTGYSFAPSFLEFSGESTELNFTGTLRPTAAWTTPPPTSVTPGQTFQVGRVDDDGESDARQRALEPDGSAGGWVLSQPAGHRR